MNATVGDLRVQDRRKMNDIRNDKQKTKRIHSIILFMIRYIINFFIICCQTLHGYYHFVEWIYGESPYANISTFLSSIIKQFLENPNSNFFITYITRRVLYVHHISLPTDTMLEKDFQNSKYLEMYGKTKAWISYQ